MRILILSQESPPDRGIGGIGSYTATIAPSLVARGHEVHVLSSRPEAETSDIVSGGVWLHRRPAYSFRGLNRIIGQSPEAGRRIQIALSNYRESRKLGVDFDIVESPEWMAEGLFFGLFDTTPLIAHLHSPVRLLAHYTGFPAGRDLRFADYLERALVRRAIAVTTPSRLLDRRLREDGWLHSPTLVIPHPIDTARWAPRQARKSTRPTVLFVGRLENTKAPEVLVQAAARLQSAVADLDVVFIGRTSGQRGGVPYGEWTANRAAELSANCRFLDWVPREDLPSWYQRARVVAVPSRFETFSMTALEAMASARPVVYTSQVGAGEVLAGSGGGSEVPPDDPDALAEALLPYLLNPTLADDAGLAAFDAVGRSCACAHVAALREKCYEEAIAIRGSRHEHT